MPSAPTKTKFKAAGGGQSAMESGLRQRLGSDRRGREEGRRRASRSSIFTALNSSLASLAQQIVQYVAEIKKPDGERLAGYHESQLESLRLRMFSPAPIYPDMEIARITGALELDLAEVGPNDPWVKMVLNGKSPREVATELVNGTKLADPEVRKKLVEGGEAAVAASTDSMIVLARKLDPMRRELTKWLEDNVQSVEQRAGEQLGKARFAAFGKSTYPDATFTLRLSYGQVKGYPMNGTIAPPMTTYVRAVRPVGQLRQHRTRSSCRSAMWKAATSSICRRRSISSPPTILSAATPARRWSTRTARSWA